MINFPNFSDFLPPTDAQGHFNPFPAITQTSGAGFDRYLGPQNATFLATVPSFGPRWKNWLGLFTASAVLYGFLRLRPGSSRSVYETGGLELLPSAAISRSTASPLPVSDSMFVRSLLVAISRSVAAEESRTANAAIVARAQEVQSFEAALLLEVNAWLERSGELSSGETRAQQEERARDQRRQQIVVPQTMAEALAANPYDDIPPGSLQAYLYDLAACPDRGVLGAVLERLMQLHALEVPGHDLTRERAELELLLRNFPFNPQRHVPITSSTPRDLVSPLFREGRMGYVRFMAVLRTLADRFGNLEARRLYHRYLNETDVEMFRAGEEASHYFAMEVAIAHLEGGEALVSQSHVLQVADELAFRSSQSTTSSSLIRVAFVINEIERQSPRRSTYGHEESLFTRARHILSNYREEAVPQAQSGEVWDALPLEVLRRMGELGNTQAASEWQVRTRAITTAPLPLGEHQGPLGAGESGASAVRVPELEEAPSLNELTRGGLAHSALVVSSPSHAPLSGRGTSIIGEGVEIFFKAFQGEMPEGEDRHRNWVRDFWRHGRLRGIR